MSFLPPKVVQRLSREIADLHKNPIDDIALSQNLDDLSEIQATITGPIGTPYEGGLFTIKLVLSDEFPHKPPKGYFTTKIFHPNVAREGDICVNTLKRDWVSTLGLRHVLLVIRCLMIEPNPDSALNADAGRLIQENYEAFAEKAKMFTSIHAKPAATTIPTTTTTTTEPNMSSTSCNASSTTTTTTTTIATPQKLLQSNISFLSPANRAQTPNGGNLAQEILFTTLEDTKENLGTSSHNSSSNSSSLVTAKKATSLKASALLTKKSAVTKVNAKNDAAKKKALNRL